MGHLRPRALHFIPYPWHYYLNAHDQYMCVADHDTLLFRT